MLDGGSILVIREARNGGQHRAGDLDRGGASLDLHSSLRQVPSRIRDGVSCGSLHDVLVQYQNAGRHCRF